MVKTGRRQKPQVTGKVRKTAKRISMSLPPDLLKNFDNAMEAGGFTDRSKAIQTALHSFIDQSHWNLESKDDSRNGAGIIMLVYNNHSYNHGSASTDLQHHFNDIIGASTHLHLDHETCLEAIMVRGRIKAIKQLAKKLSGSRGIKDLKVNFVTTTV